MKESTAEQQVIEVERQLRQVDPVRVAVERAVDVGAGVRAERDHADLELGARSVDRPAALAREVVADDRAGQSGIRRHAVLDDVAEVDPRPAVATRHLDTPS